MHDRFALLNMVQYRIPLSVRTKLPDRGETKNLFDGCWERIKADVLQDTSKRPKHIESLKSYQLWHDCLEYYVQSNRLDDALLFCKRLYTELFKFQNENQRAIHCGDCFWQMSMLYDALNQRWYAQMYRMLGICQDSLYHFENGELQPDFKDFGASRIWLKEVVQIGDDSDFIKLFELLVALHTNLPNCCQRWPEMHMLECVHTKRQDVSLTKLRKLFVANSLEESLPTSSPALIPLLLSAVDKGRTRQEKGEMLERLVRFLFLEIPGCELRPKTSRTTQLDGIGFFRGKLSDARSELGRYFIVECKATEKPMGVAALHKLESDVRLRRMRLAIAVSLAGFSGQKGKKREPSREVQRKAYEHGGVAMLFLDRWDLMRLANEQQLRLTDLLDEKFHEINLG